MFALFWTTFGGILCILFYNYYYKRRNLPPGPTPLPFVGNLASIIKSSSAEECFLKWSKQYGSIYTFWMCELPIVVVTDYQKIIQYFQRDGETYSGRYNFEKFNEIVSGGNYGVVFTDGNFWREHRRFALQVFRDFGIGKNIMQEKILNEIDVRFNALNKQIESGVEEIKLQDTIDLTIGSIINSMLVGYRFEEENNTEFFQLKNLLYQFTQASGSLANFFVQWNPYIFRHLPGFKHTFNALKNINDELIKFFEKQINKHLNEIDLDGDKPSTDYIEAYLKQKSKLDKNNEEHFFSRKQLIHMCIDLWITGQETTTTALAWGLNFLIHNPEKQLKLQNELDTVIGLTDRYITVNDKQNLPYTSAVINEILRCTNLLPINLLRRTTKDTTIDNFFIPKNTTIIPQISTIFCNEEYFENPKIFNPDRFIDENGKLKKVDELIPFSIGKRQCLGETLARMELFLFISNLLNRYKISSAKTLPSLKRTFGFTIICPTYKCKIEKRIKN